MKYLPWPPRVMLMSSSAMPSSRLNRGCDDRSPGLPRAGIPFPACKNFFRTLGGNQRSCICRGPADRWIRRPGPGMPRCQLNAAANTCMRRLSERHTVLTRGRVHLEAGCLAVFHPAGRAPGCRQVSRWQTARIITTHASPHKKPQEDPQVSRRYGSALLFAGMVISHRPEAVQDLPARSWRVLVAGRIQ